MSKYYPEKTTVWDCAVVMVNGGSASGLDCVWLPGGLLANKGYTEEEIKEVYINNGFTENTEYEYTPNNGMLMDEKDRNKYLNQFSFIEIPNTSSPLSYDVATFEVNENNLFGEKPVVSVWLSITNIRTFLGYGNTIWLTKDTHWKSET